MKKRAPGIVIAVAAIQFTIALSCVGVAGANGMFVLRSLHTRDRLLRDQETILNQTVPLRPVYRALNIILPLFLSLLLVTFGIGLLLRGRWARYGTIATAGFILLHRLVDLLFYFVFVVPAQNEAFNSVVYPMIENRIQLERDPATAEMGGRIGYFIGSGGIQAIGSDCFGVVYSVFVLVVMFLPSVQKAFRRKRRRRRLEYDDFDYDYS